MVHRAEGPTARSPTALARADISPVPLLPAAQNPVNFPNMSPTILIVIAIVITVIVLRIFFKIAGWIIKLLVLAAVGLAIYWLFNGM